MLVSATGKRRTEGFDNYALDNGAWTAHQQGVPFRPDLFMKLMDELGAGADWVAVPDIVGGGLESLRTSVEWLPRLESYGVPMLIPVQDGMVADDLRALLGDQVGIFVGGTTPFKLASTSAVWGPLAKETGCHLHVGRVNTAKRIMICKDAGAHSFDGTSVTKFPCTLPRLDRARRMPHLF